jgi:hypothetical protein
MLPLVRARASQNSVGGTVTVDGMKIVLLIIKVCSC